MQKFSENIDESYDFFEIMKNEMFYGPEYEFKSLDQLKKEMIKYIDYYNKSRITVKLKDYLLYSIDNSPIYS